MVHALLFCGMNSVSAIEAACWHTANN